MSQAIVTGILETALYVADRARAARFYQDVFGFPILLDDDRLTALGVADRNVLLLFQRGASADGDNPVPGGNIPSHDAHGEVHITFAVPADSLPAWEAKLAETGIAIESRVDPPQGGHSLYFRDPDGNLLEVATPGLWPIY